MNWLIKTIHALSPNCKEAIRLQSDALDRPLPLLRRIGLRIHLFLCVWCSRYGKQIKFLRTAAQHCDHEHEPAPALPQEARERIKEQVKSALET
ncbi:MAG: hypothetical protein PHY43_11940 [Verrucomicrobiales bacterium]|nr:hypothetical protein [Verrucomicrobiales bacterium]